MALLISLTFLGAPPAAAASGAVAVNRCDSRMINDYASQVRDYDAHPPRGDIADLQKRFNDINQLLQGLSQERTVIDSVCQNGADKVPLFAYLGATASYALALESDVALRINLPCLAGAKAVAQALLAQGWLDLAMIVNDAEGKVPKDVTDAAPRIQTRAATLGLTLPSWTDTSAYWRDNINKLARATIEACPTPVPSGNPSPTASP